jgi:hypothetical protein
MARISHPLSETELKNAINWYFSLDNVGILIVNEAIVMI